MNIHKLTIITISILFTYSANAALVGRLASTPGGTDYQAYYDTEADLTWLADANYAQTSGFDADGLVYWADHVHAWIDDLVIGGVGGWRLPTMVDVDNDGATYTDFNNGVDYGYNITAYSELANMYYNVLGNTAAYGTDGTPMGCEWPDYCLLNTGPFSNLVPGTYWFDTEVITLSGTGLAGSAWYFSMTYGNQSYWSKIYASRAWLVHDVDVAELSSVPVPAAAWLFASGIIGLFGISRYKRK